MERNKRILFSGTIAVISRNLVLLSIGRIFQRAFPSRLKSCNNAFFVGLLGKEQHQLEVDFGHNLLVVEDDIGPPDVIRRDMKHVDPTVLSRVPLELVVPPVLLHPQVGRHDLVLQVLNRGDFICIRDRIVKM